MFIYVLDYKSDFKGIVKNMIVPHASVGLGAIQ